MFTSDLCGDAICSKSLTAAWSACAYERGVSETAAVRARCQDGPDEETGSRYPTVPERVPDSQGSDAQRYRDAIGSRRGWMPELRPRRHASAPCPPTAVLEAAFLQRTRFRCVPASHSRGNPGRVALLAP